MMPAFTKPTCRGSYALGTACGNCERCEWERAHGPWKGEGAKTRPDRTVTEAHVVVISEDLNVGELKVALAERLKGLEIEIKEVRRVEMTYPEEDGEKKPPHSRARTARD